MVHFKTLANVTSPFSVLQYNEYSDFLYLNNYATWFEKLLFTYTVQPRRLKQTLHPRTFFRDFCKHFSCTGYFAKLIQIRSKEGVVKNPCPSSLYNGISFQEQKSVSQFFRCHPGTLTRAPRPPSPPPCPETAEKQSAASGKRFIFTFYHKEYLRVRRR